MSDPTDPYDQPQPERPQWEQPGWQQPEWGPPPVPQYGPPPVQPPPVEPQYGPPVQYGQPPQYGPPVQYGPPAEYGVRQYPVAPPFEPLPAGKAPRTGRTKVLVAASVALVVVAGAAVSFVAFRDKNSGSGSSTPQGAVKAVVADLTKSDILGILDDLPPAERTALSDSFTTEVTQLKRLKVLNPSADPGQVTGVTVRSTGLTFGADEVINDHVRIVNVTGGTITLASDAGSVPYTKAFLAAAFPKGAPTGQSSNTINIATEVGKSGHPARIAVQKVDGKWFPSLMYTIVDAVNQEDGNADPTADDAIPAIGSASPQAAVKALVSAATSADAAQAIATLDPNESAALHEYGTLLTSGSGAGSGSGLDPGVTIDELSLSSTAITGGTRVSLKSVTVTDAESQTTTTVTIDGDCLSVRADGDSHRFCAAEAIDLIGTGDIDLSPAEKTALDNLFRALPRVGVVTTEVGGKWFVSPIRSYADLSNAVLSGLGPNDLLVLIALAQRTR